MHPGQQSSLSTPWSDEEIQLFIKLREDMDKTFRIVNKIGRAGLWVELSRRLAALGHQRSHEELEAKFGRYKPRQSMQPKRVLQANQQEQVEDSSALQPCQTDPQDESVRNQGVEAARKKLIEEIDLSVFFCEENNWRAAIISFKQGRSEAVLGD